ncbi:MAG: hypothetical protein Kapaf2KO_23980 [Candidatus Kapaibacteriales bacterium]
MPNTLFVLLLFAFAALLMYTFSNSLALKRVIRRSGKKESYKVLFETNFENVRDRIRSLCENGIYRLHLSNPNEVIISDPVTMMDFGYFYRVFRDENQDVNLIMVPRNWIEIDIFRKKEAKKEALSSHLRG